MEQLLIDRVSTYLKDACCRLIRGRMSVQRHSVDKLTARSLGPHKMPSQKQRSKDYLRYHEKFSRTVGKVQLV